MPSKKSDTHFVPYQLSTQEQTELLKFKETYADGHQGALESEVRFGEFHGDDKNETRSRFQPGVSKNLFVNILKKFENLSGSFFEPFTSRDCLKIIANKCTILIDGPDIQSAFTQPPPKWVKCIDSAYCKQQHGKIDNPGYGYRLSLATESTISPVDAMHRLQLVLGNTSEAALDLRWIRRYSFTTKDRLHRIDMSISKTLQQVQSIDVKTSILLNRQPQKYEMELESLAGTTAPDDRKFLETEEVMITFVLGHIQSTLFPMSRYMRDSVLEEYLDSFWRTGQRTAHLSHDLATRQKYFLGAMPVSLSLEAVVDPSILKDRKIVNIRKDPPNHFAVTEKADGTRSLLYITGTGEVFGITRQMHVFYTNVRSSMTKSLFDAEFLDGSSVGTLLVFDTLFADSQDVRRRPLLARSREQSLPEDRVTPTMKLADSCSQADTSLPSADIRPKLHTVHLDDHGGMKLIDSANDLWKQRFHMFDHDVDGLFFTSAESPYPCVERGPRTWLTCLKWKPINLLSIDFQVFFDNRQPIQYASVPPSDLLPSQKESEDDTQSPDELDQSRVSRIEYRIVDLYVLTKQSGEIRKPASAPGLLKNIFNPSLKIDRELQSGKSRIILDTGGQMTAVHPISSETDTFKNRDVVEFVYDRYRRPGFEWVPIRVRHDKSQPNRSDTAEQVWQSMHESDGRVSDGSFFSNLLDKEFDEALKSSYQMGVSQAYYLKETPKERRASSIRPLRNFHNAIKRYLFLGVSNYLRSAYDDEKDSPDEQGLLLKCLELGCGRGGEFDKYREAGISVIVGVDIDKEGLTEMARRFDAAQNSILNDAKRGETKETSESPEIVTRKDRSLRSLNLFRADITKILSNGSAALDIQSHKKMEQYWKRIGKYNFDIVSCQFALHYCLKDEMSIRTFMANVHENLAMGGMFCATAFDGATIIRAFNSVSEGTRTSDELTFFKNGEQFAAIKKNFSGNRLAPFGQRIDVQMKTISSEFNTEFLIDFPWLMNVFEKDYGIRPLDRDECRILGLKHSVGPFTDFMTSKDFSMHFTEMGDDEKRWSSLSSYMVLKKSSMGNARVIQKWNKLISGQ